MKIAIHNREGSFSDVWIAYCKQTSLDYKLVNGYDHNIIEQIKDCDIFMWHFDHVSYKDAIAAKPILYSIEQAGLKVYPDMKTCWHFDDKISQKYLLEALKASLIPTYIFYSKNEAVTWAKATQYPKVFKLKGGAGGTNVILVHNFSQCLKVINKAFGKGFSAYNTWNTFKDRLKNFKKSKKLTTLFKAFGRLIVPNEFARMSARQKGYVYFQEFVPNNDSDIRIIVINQKRAYGMRRMNREGDFRASGSGVFVYDDIPIEVVRTALKTAKKLQMQSVAFDFIISDSKPVIIEMSYGFGTKGSSQCKGFWTENLEWKEGSFSPITWILQSLIEENNDEIISFHAVEK